MKIFLFKEQSSQPLVGHPWRAVCNIYCAALFKSAFFNLALHYDIVRMSVYSDVCVVFLQVLDGTPENAVNPAITCDSMDGYIFIIIEPFAIFDMFVCRFITPKNRKHSMDIISFADQMTSSIFNVEKRIRNTPMIKIDY